MRPISNLLFQIVVLFLAGLVLQPGAKAQEFTTPPFYPTVGLEPGYIATGDFNGDGKPDLVLSDYYTSQISVLINRGDGTFILGATYVIGPDNPLAAGVQTGDFNGDGKLDIAVVEEQIPGSIITGGVAIFLGNGDGTFQSPVTYASGGQEARGLAVGDFNGDHKLDLMVANQQQSSGGFGGAVGILLGNGDGTFQAPITTTTQDGFLNAGVTGDFNKDGKLDMAVIDGSGLQVFLGNGNGTFQPPVTYNQSRGTITCLAVGDLNNDGVLDIVTGSNVGDIGVFIGKGDGTFQPEVQYFTSLGGQLAVAVSDLNGDGKLDVVTNEVAVLFGNGDGTVQPPVFYDPGNIPSDIVVADVNGDGHPDIAASLDSSTNTIPDSAGILINNGDGTFKAPVVTPYPPSLPYAASPLAGDFNHDGKFDFAVLSLIGDSVGVYLGNGDGTFQPPVVTTGLRPSTTMASADFNGDGNLDLVTGGQGQTVTVLLGNGDGTFRKAAHYSLPATPHKFATGDFNGDGKPDIAAITYPSADAQEVSILINNGDGTFKTGGNFAVGEDPYDIVAGDFNKDGKLDLAVINVKSSNVSILLGNGDGTFQNAVSYSVPLVPFNPTLATADMNNDGKLDLVVHVAGVDSMDFLVDSLAVLLGNGDGTFQTAIVSLYSGGNFAISDFTGDGILDVAGTASSAQGGDLFINFGDGSGHFRFKEYSTGALYALASDLNGDGASDLVLFVPTGGTVPQGYIVLLNNGGTFDTLTSSPNPSHFRQPVTFRATINASVPGAPGGMPTGTVTFKDGANTLGMVTLKNGKARLATSKLTVGTHSITAAYSGDSNFNPNVSAPITQTVVSAMVELSPAKLDFSRVKVGMTSPPQTSTLTNSGTADLNIKSIALTGDFAQTNTCPATLAPAANCTITVTFTPTQNGTLTGDASFTDNAPGSPQKIKLKGIGVH